MKDYIPHLIELRSRIIKTAWVVAGLFVCLFSMDEKLYSLIARPLLSQLPIGSTLIATEVTAPFMVPMKLAFMLSLFSAIPYILYQVWSFVAPGLYPTEKIRILPFLVTSTGLFYIGMIFAYVVMCPMALGFFAHCAPKGVTMMTDIQSYLNFVLSMLFAGGLGFQVPVITVALVQFNLVTIQQLHYLRPYIIVAAFVVGMLLTPPDVVSQILLALPMWGLFELGLVLAQYLQKN